MISEKKINIAFLMNGAKPPRGAEFYTLYLITHLSRNIFNPILIYSREGEIVKKVKEAGIEGIQLQLSEELLSIYLRENKLCNPILIIKIIFYLLRTKGFFKLKEIIFKRDIKLIYGADNLSKLIGGIIGKVAKTKVVAHCHDDFEEDSLGKIMRFFYLSFLDKIFTVSDKTREFFISKKNGFSKTITIYNGIDTNIYNPDIVDNDLKRELGFKEKSIVIGSVGAFDNIKKQIFLLEALLKLKSKGMNNIICVICGKGPEEENLKRFVYEKGIVDIVLFLGYRNDIPRVLKILDLLVMTSSFEACPMAVIEAMAMAVPIVASKVGGIPELVEDGKTGILYPFGDIESLSNSIQYLIENPEIRYEMGRNARQRVLERFDITKNTRSIEEVLLNL